MLQKKYISANVKMFSKIQNSKQYTFKSNKRLFVNTKLTEFRKINV